MAIRLLIADDHDIVRDGLRLAFDGTEVQIAAEAVNGQQAFELLSHNAIDVALVDLSMPIADGFRFLELARAHNVNIPTVIHSVHDGHARKCRELGARGFVLKGDDRDLLLAAIRAVHQGNEFWP